MTNIVRAAREHSDANPGSNESTVWNVTFLDGETRSGTVKNIGSDHYVIEGTKSAPIFFAADKVLRMWFPK
ncbi:hypothetical protein GTP58_24495 [Duganella sp. CY15W]|uniref:hypothetical protein n=1 Tax=Duganella sp. CY15W TaxID=2692172 RepID=UPI00137153D0|nr:hypothetical protein [Duganella sp. CY15W]MYM31498.1 hypothetical protein [Duganella sp. CY15W]